MNRREFIGAGAMAGAVGFTTAGADTMQPHYYELRTYYLRSDMEPQRVRGFLKEHLVPALKKSGTSSVAAFTPVTGMRTPSILLVIGYTSLGEMQQSMERMRDNTSVQGAYREMVRQGGAPFERYESSLLRAFSGHPAMEVQPSGEQPGRLFELRTYESKDDIALAAKVAMFNQEEIAIFRRSGINPVFFGEAVTGVRLPHLTYMVAYKDMADRDAAWGRFGGSEDWKRIKDLPGWTDAEAVSNITSVYLRALDYSDVR